MRRILTWLTNVHLAPECTFTRAAPRALRRELRDLVARAGDEAGDEAHALRLRGGHLDNHRLPHLSTVQWTLTMLPLGVIGSDAGRRPPSSFQETPRGLRPHCRPR